MRALNEPKVAKFEDIGAELCVFKSNAPGLKLYFCGPYYRKRGSASYIVREVHSVRERDTERERERERERKTEVTSPLSR